MYKNKGENVCAHMYLHIKSASLLIGAALWEKTNNTNKLITVVPDGGLGGHGRGLSAAYTFLNT